jgi:predicted nucleic acid-binding protein
MNVEVFLDSNVLVYSMVTDDPRSAIATALLERGGTISRSGSERVHQHRHSQAQAILVRCNGRIGSISEAVIESASRHLGDA